MSDEVYISIGGSTSASSDTSTITAGSKLSGWENIAITRRAEGFPGEFSISATAAIPIAGAAAQAVAGAKCTVSIGDDKVITGYIDRDVQSVGPTSHVLELIGRGKTQDMVDCSAEWETGQILSATVLDIAIKLAEPYGVTVTMADGATPGDPVPQFNLNYGETSAGIIQRLAQSAGLLAYENELGELELARVGTKKAASGVTYGVNVQASSVINSVDQRYSVIRCAASAINVLGDIQGSNDSFFYFDATDPNITRHRLLYLVTLQAADSHPFTILRAKWEAARRAGRGTMVHATVDSWRDSAGKLWTPNTLIDVALPGLRTKELCIAEVTYRRSSEDGTVADLVMMPPGAFAPEPVSLQPVNLNDIQAGGGVQ